MRAIRFEEVAKLINYSRVSEIRYATPLHEDGHRKWTMYKGVNRVPNFVYDFYVLYLSGDATRESISAAASVVTEPAKTQVVYAPSLERRVRRNELAKQLNTLKPGISIFQSTREYLLSFITDQLSKYRDQLGAAAPYDYVDPAYVAPDGISHKYPNPIKLFLDSPEREADFNIATLLGEPGQGKTYTARHVAGQLSARGNPLPIYIDSRQWHTLPAADLTSLWKTITHSFRHFDAAIDWIDGCEEEFVEVTLKAGLFCILFDGLDEYVLWNHGKVQAQQVVANLDTLARDCHAPILVTCRTSFWQANVEPAMPSSNGYATYTIQPFDRSHATNYFKRKFDSDQNRVGRALAIYRSLEGLGGARSEGNFVGRGFILHLIADLADRTEAIPAVAGKATSVVQWIMNALCEREKARQNLPLQAKEQLRVIGTLAEEIARGTSVTTDLLRLILQTEVSALNPAELDNLVGSAGGSGSLQDHPLLRKEQARDEWGFTHDQILFNLLAQKLMSHAEKDPPRLRSLLESLTTAGVITDIAACIVDEITSKDESDVWKRDKIRTYVDAVLRCRDKSSRNGRSEAARSLATTIALVALDRLCPRGNEHRQRTSELLSYFPSGQLRGLTFTGTISSLDFTGTTFEDCRFERVTWANCDFERSTGFLNCEFVGGLVLHSAGFGEAQWKEAHCDRDALSMINAERVRAGHKDYDPEDLRHDMEQLIKKFMPKDGATFKSVLDKHLLTGTVARSPNGKEVIDVFSKHLLERNIVPGMTSHAFHVKDSVKNCLRHYAVNGVFTGPLLEAYQELLKNLKVV